MSKKIKTNNRLDPSVRKEDILKAALVCAEKVGVASVTRDVIAEKVGISGPAVQYHFGTMAKLRKAVMRYAVTTRNLKVIAQGLLIGDTQALKAPEAVRHQALKSLTC